MARQKLSEEERKERERARRKAWREANPEKVRASGRAYYKANAEKVRETAKVWREANPDRMRSGLHVFTNLQIITAKENKAKKNKFPGQRVNHIVDSNFTR